jgi:hypothetical protein
MASWHPGERPEAVILLLLDVDDSGRTSVRELRVSGGNRVEAALLRQIPLGAIERVLNGIRIGRGVNSDEATKIRAVKTYKVEPNEDSDVFYSRVAELYLAAGAEAPNPAQRLAADNDVSRRTVSRWLAEARRRGLMRPARSGAAKLTAHARLTAKGRDSG